jgi:hypothetical protein
MRTSCATQIYDLGQALLQQGHQVTIITGSASQQQNIVHSVEDGVELNRIKAYPTKDINYVWRILAEFFNPFVLWMRLRSDANFMRQKVDGVIWYSPTIFWGPLIRRLRYHFDCSSYLILRDFFPDWTAHLGLLSESNPLYWFLKKVEIYQYAQASTIGIQSPNNVRYFLAHQPLVRAKLEVLWNWGGKSKMLVPEIGLTKPAPSLATTALGGKVIFVYAGNMGLAQGMESVIKLIHLFAARPDVGFLLVGRGSEVEKLKQEAHTQAWTHVLFWDEIEFEYLPQVLSQCQIGIVSLDARHQSHNIPGKLISYLQAGLPVLAFVNKGNDLQRLIPQYKVGSVWASDNLQSLEEIALEVIHLSSTSGIAQHCQQVGEEWFSATKAAAQITESLSNQSITKI